MLIIKTFFSFLFFFFHFLCDLNSDLNLLANIFIIFLRKSRKILLTCSLT